MPTLEFRPQQPNDLLRINDDEPLKSGDTFEATAEAAKDLTVNPEIVDVTGGAQKTTDPQGTHAQPSGTASPSTDKPTGADADGI